MRRFTSQELSFLRNEVPIERVIVEFLSIPTHKESDKLRFACPRCNGFETSIHPEENIARCFYCKQTYNPIEIVMGHLHREFVESVKWLKHRIDKFPSKKLPPQRFIQKPSAPKSSKSPPTTIGNILKDLLPPLSSKELSETNVEALQERIKTLEKKVDGLYLLVT